MKILKFKLSGNTAFFRNNELNDGDVTFSFGHIHKVALFGILGAILGLEGHNQAYYKEGPKYTHPEFYKTFKDCKVAITPNSEYGYFQRKKYNMINNCGYSKNKDTKKGQSLMYTEQWLEKPSWTIYIKVDTIPYNLRDMLVDYILNNKSVYLPYLGKTNHPAVIEETELLDGEVTTEDIIVINSLFELNDNIKHETNLLDNLFSGEMANEFEYREVLPVGYIEDRCYYNSKMHVFSNKKFKVQNTEIVKVNSKNIIFS